MSCRILHVVGRMNPGGVESWIMHVLRTIDRQQYQMDILVQTNEPGSYDDEIRALGCRIIPCSGHTRPWSFTRKLNNVLNKFGPYDVVHSHVHHFSGYVMRIAEHHGVAVRIAHSHSDRVAVEARRGLIRKLYLQLMKRWVRIYASTGVAVSELAAISLFGPDWEDDPRWRILYCGVDLGSFGVDVNRKTMRAKLGIPDDALVIGHVGRFAPPKNHLYWLDIAAEILLREPHAWFILVGDGSLRGEIEVRARQLGIHERVVLTGFRSDIPQLMQGAMDVFLFPSLYEGLPLVLIEALAAGLPCIVSDAVTKEVDIVPELITRLSLDEPVEAWCEAVLQCVYGRHFSAEDALHRVIESQFNILHSNAALMDIYKC